MLSIYHAAGPISQLSNLSFLLAAIFGDILLIRLFLSLAYIFLFAAAMVGAPRWPSVNSTGGIFLDSVLWAAISGLMHILALVRLVWDERPIHFDSADEEQLYRFFNRRSGMGRLEMKQVLKYGRWKKVKAGQVILDPVRSCSTLCLLIEGLAMFVSSAVGGSNPLSALEPGTQPVSNLLFSGTFFDMRLLNCFGLYIGMEGKNSSDEKWFVAVAKTDCLLYEWNVQELSELATKCSPAVSQSWRNLLATQLGIMFAWREMSQHVPPTCATGEPESPAILSGARSRDFQDELRKYEMREKVRIPQLFLWLLKSVHPFIPPGIRHNGLPTTGILARNRIIALKDAQLRKIAALEHESDGYNWNSAENLNVEELENRTLHMLRNLESIQVLDSTDVVKIARRDFAR